MTKLLTVTQVRNRLNKLIEQGHGTAPVINRDGNKADPKLTTREVGYIGGSPYDDRTFTIGREGTGASVII